MSEGVSSKLMKSLFRFLSKHKVIVLLAFLIMFIGFVSVAYIFNLSWTGFPADTGPSLPQNVQYRSAKTMWDWLAAFAFPVVIGLGVAWYTTKFNEQQRQTEHEIALDNQREEALQAYLDRISELLLQTNSSDEKPDQKVLMLIRARTLTTLKRLDPDRKTSLFGFLWEAGLIGKFNLDEADLSGADLHGYTLSGAKLRNANLSRADLSGATLDNALLIDANLTGANLSRTMMHDADLRKADLTDANLTGAYLTRTNLKEAIYCEKQVNKALKIEGLIK